MGRLLSVKSVGDITSLSRATIYRLITQGKFPKQVTISTRRVGWREEDIAMWKEQLA